MSIQNNTAEKVCACQNLITQSKLLNFHPLSLMFFLYLSKSSHLYMYICKVLYRVSFSLQDI